VLCNFNKTKQLRRSLVNEFNCNSNSLMCLAISADSHGPTVVTPQTAPQPDREASEQITYAGHCSNRDLPFERNTFSTHHDKSTLDSGDKIILLEV
jgi:hypothetical protein